MTNPFVKFISKTTLVLGLAFAAHLGVLKVYDRPIFENKIILSYVVNLAMVVGVFGLLYLLKNKYKSQLGFLFLAGSMLKFAIFFIVFQPIYKADDAITKLEFAAFFVPYALGLILETISLTKWLSDLDES